MLHAMVAAAFQDVAEADQVGVDIGGRVLQRVAHPGLGGQVDHALRLVLAEHPLHRLAVADVHALLGEALVILDPRQPRLLQRHVVVVVQVVDADDLVAAFQQTQGQRIADKAGGSGNEYFHVARIVE